MDFGIFSNGFRPHTSAARSYDEDLREIVFADELGFAEAWISEHHGELLYVDKVDVLPAPELLMCKAAGLTERIKFGAAARVLHLTHPVDVATQAAVADNVIGGGRYMFGFGTGFPNAAFCDARGLSFDDRQDRTMESLELVRKCWESSEPFDWKGRHWTARNVTVLPKPMQRPHMPVSVATSNPATITMAAERGYGILTGGTASSVRAIAQTYAAASPSTESFGAQLKVSFVVYLAETREQAIEDLRPAVEYEMIFLRQRGLLGWVAQHYGVDATNDTMTFDHMVDAGMYLIGHPDEVYPALEAYYEESGGFGTFLVITGKQWATFDKRANSLRLFMSELAPRLQRLGDGAV